MKFIKATYGLSNATLSHTFWTFMLQGGCILKMSWSRMVVILHILCT